MKKAATVLKSQGTVQEHPHKNCKRQTTESSRGTAPPWCPGHRDLEAFTPQDRLARLPGLQAARVSTSRAASHSEGLPHAVTAVKAWQTLWELAA